MKLKLSTLGGTVGLFIAAVSAGYSQSITISNNGLTNSSAGNYAYASSQTYVGTPTSWTTVNSGGAFSVYNTNGYVNNAVGPQFLESYSGSGSADGGGYVYQTLANNYIAGDTYTLTALVGGDNSGHTSQAGDEIVLWNTNFTILGSYTVPTTTGNGSLTQYSFNYTASSADNGTPIVLGLYVPAQSGQAWTGFNDFTLTVLAPSLFYWSNSPADSNWANGANWVGSSAPVSSNTTVLSFGATTGSTTLNNNIANQTNSALTFSNNAPAYTINGNAMTLGSGINNSSTNTQTINTAVAEPSGLALTTTNNGGNLVVNGAISGAGGVSASGGGTVTLTASNSFSGGTTLNGGTLVASNSSALGSGGLTFAGSSTLSTLAPVTFGSLSLGSGATGTINNNSNNLTFGGSISGAGGLALNGSGMLSILSANTYTGPTTLNVPVVAFANNNPFGTGTLTVATSSTLSNSSTVVSGNLTFGSLTSIGSGQTLTINAGASASPLANASQVTLSGTISGAGALSLIASPTNWFTITSGSGIGSPNGNSYSGGTTLSNGIVQFYGTSTPFGTGTVTVAGSASVRNIAQPGAIANAFVINSGQTLTLTNPAQGTPAYTGVISGAGGLNASSQPGGNAVALGGSNTYTGPTTIVGSTLTLNAGASINGSTNINLGTAATQGTLDVSANPSYTLGTNQTLSGYGSVNVGSGTLTLNGKIAPYSAGSNGIVAVTGNLTLGSASTTTLVANGTNAAGTSFDAIHVSGALSYNGILNIVLNLGTPGSYQLFTVGSYTNNPASVALAGSWNPSSFTNQGNGIWTDNQPGQYPVTFNDTGLLTVAVPEPSTWALFGVGGLVLALVYRRRTV